MSSLDFFHTLKARDIDYLLLAYLQLPDLITNDYPALVELKAICSSNGLESRSQLQTLVSDLKTYITEVGIQPICPKRFIMARTKDKAIAQYNTVKSSWGVHIPYIFQTFNEEMKNMIIFICANPQDAVIRMHDILKEKCIVYNSQSLDVCGIIEHAMDEFTIVRQIFDCEVLLSHFQGSLSKDRILDLMRSIPTAISSRFIETGVVSEESFVVFDLKNRSRHIGGDYKASYHIETNVFAPKNIHDYAMKPFIGPEMKMLEKLRSNKKLLADFDTHAIEALTPFQIACLFLDTAALPGGANGITGFFSRKSSKDPFPTYEKRAEIFMGSVVSEEFFLATSPHDFDSTELSTKDRYALLCNLSLTIPPFNTYMITYQDSLIAQARSSAVISRQRVIAEGRDQLPKAILDRLPRPLASSSSSSLNICGLPKWFTSALSHASGKDPRVSNARKKQDMLPGWAKENLVELVHVMPCYCVRDMAMGELRMHKSNGTYVCVIQNPKNAEHNEENAMLLLSCPVQSHRIIRNEFPDLIQIVRKCFKKDEAEHASNQMETVKETDFSQSGSSQGGILWILVDGKKGFERMLDGLSSGGGETSRKVKRPRLSVRVQEEDGSGFEITQTLVNHPSEKN